MYVPAASDSVAVHNLSLDSSVVVVPTIDHQSSKIDGMRIAFKDLSYSVPSNSKKGERATLLNNVSGFFEPGQMAALMGPSGSGKTTLLDILAGRKTQGKIEGALQFGGEKPTPAFLKRYTGYVEQFDTLIPSLTVSEMLLYTAELKRPRQESLDSKKAAVEHVLNKLSLNTCRDTAIGSSMARGISGGQSKRTNIGIALITNPRVLFLDEPTSGLDSHTSNGVMTAVKALAKDGVTICATIHSPSAYCFGLFDRLLLLVRGNVVYFGETGPGMIEFMQQTAPPKVAALIGNGSSFSNDAEWMMEMVTEADEAGMHSELAAAYQGSGLKQQTDAVLDSYLTPASKSQQGSKLWCRSDTAAVAAVTDNSTSSGGSGSSSEMGVTQATATPWWWGLKTLLKYRTLKNYRDPAFLGPRLADKLIMALLILTLYLNVGSKPGTENLINLSAVLFMWCVLPAFGAAGYVPSIVLDRGLFVRERNDGLYRTFTYLLAKMIEELALALVTSVVASLMVFFAVDLAGSFLTFWLSYYVTLCNGIAVAYLIAGLSPNMDVANAALPVYVTMLLFFGGQLIRFVDMPSYWYWFSTIDFVKYAWGTLMVNQFEASDPQYLTGTVLQTFGFDGVNKWAYLGYQSLFFVFYFGAAVVVMSVKKYQQR